MRAMATTMLIVGTLAAMVIVARPAWADHNSLVTPGDAGVERGTSAESAKPEGSTTASSLDIDLKLGWNGFRFGSRLFGREGYAGGAWLNGETRPDGFSLDGRLEKGCAGGAPCERRAHNFKMNVEVDEWLRRAARWWGRTDL